MDPVLRRLAKKIAGAEGATRAGVAPGSSEQWRLGKVSAAGQIKFGSGTAITNFRKGNGVDTINVGTTVLCLILNNEVIVVQHL